MAMMRIRSAFADSARRRSGPATGEPRRRLGRRLPFMLGAFIAYSLAEVLAKLTLLCQVVFVLCAARHSARLLLAGERVSGYIHQCWRYLLFCDEGPPWPMDRIGMRRSPPT